MNNHQSQDHADPPVDIWVSVVIIGRVIVMLVLFIALFLAIFLGYFTFPILLIAGVTVLYMLSDLGLYLRLARRRQARQERDEFLKKYSEKLDHED